jgi:CBS domain-containing membrane protein
MPTLQLSDMMVTDVKTVYEDEAIAVADWDMVVGEMRHLPVVDRERRVVGILSDRDILRVLALRVGVAVSVASVMTRDVRTAPPTMPAVEAAERLLAAKQGALVIVDGEHRILGIVTTTDFVALAHRALAGIDVQQPHVRA